MKMKRLFTWVFLLALVICQLPAQHVHAHEETAVENTTVIPEEEVVVPPVASESGSTVASGTCGENLTWKLDDAGTLAISGTGNMEFYWTTNIPWYSHKAAISKVVIREGVTNIGDYAFCDCPNLTEVTIPASVTSIEYYAFSNCGMLSKVTYCGTEAQWSKISIDIFNSTIAIVDRSYHNYCGGDCKTPEICSICGAEGNRVHASESGVCERCGEIIYKVIERGTCGENLTWTLNSDGLLTISGIGDMADYSSISHVPWRYYRESVLKVVIESGVTTIGDRTFSSCNNLTEITIPGSVTSIGRTAFFNCSNLTNITIPDSVISMGGSVFAYCSSLTEITIPKGVAIIGDYAFEGCVGLTSITIPNSVTSIDSDAFKRCDSLSEVTYCGTEEQWEQINIGTNNEALTDAERSYHNFSGGNSETLAICTICGVSLGGTLPGDMNGDNTVSDADALYLLRYTLFPERYPVEQEPDVNADGVVNDADALYLLRYTLFPERYPLYRND